MVPNFKNRFQTFAVKNATCTATSRQKLSRGKLAASLPPEVLADATRHEGGATKRKRKVDTKWAWVDKRGGKRTGAGRPKGSLGKPKELADPMEKFKKTQRRQRAHT